MGWLIYLHNQKTLFHRIKLLKITINLITSKFAVPLVPKFNLGTRCETQQNFNQPV